MGFLRYRLLAINSTCEISYQVCTRVRAWFPTVRCGDESNRTAYNGVCQREIQASFRNRVFFSMFQPYLQEEMVGSSQSFAPWTACWPECVQLLILHQGLGWWEQKGTNLADDAFKVVRHDPESSTT